MREALAGGGQPRWARSQGRDGWEVRGLGQRPERRGRRVCAPKGHIRSAATSVWGERRTIGRVTALETEEGSRREQERWHELAPSAPLQGEGERHPPVRALPVQSAWLLSCCSGHSKEEAHPSLAGSREHARNIPQLRAHPLFIHALLLSHSPSVAQYLRVGGNGCERERGVLVSHSAAL